MIIALSTNCRTNLRRRGRMLSVGTFSPFESTYLLRPNKPKFPLTGPLLPFISKNAPFISSSQQTQHTRLSLKRTRHNGLSLLLVSSIKNGGSELLEMDDSDFDDFEDFNEDDAGDDDEEKGMFIPLGQMKRWLEKKPRGFGEGKLYDTSVEDKLLQELEKSRQEQIANINKLKNEPVKPSSNKDEENNPAPEDIPSGIRVRLFNLPKKKNIHRDLKSAFEGVPGIINIIPAVSGNKKTKDPVCKGFAFVDFKSEEYAIRFVQLFSRQSIAFGKVQKQIRCEMMNSSSSNSVDEHSADDTDSDSKLTVTGLAEDSDADFDEDENSFDSVKEAASDGSAMDDKLDFTVTDSDSKLTVTGLAEDSYADIDEDEKSFDSVKEAASDGSALDDKLDFTVTDSNSKLTVTGLAGDPDADFDEDENSLDSVKEAASDGSALDDKLDFAGLEDVRESLEFVTVSESQLNGNHNTKQAKKPATDSSSSNQKKKIQAIEKKRIAKGKVKKVPKLDIPGSAKRLKIKEKALLTEVFSKYAVKAASTSKEES